MQDGVGSESVTGPPAMDSVRRSPPSVLPLRLRRRLPPSRSCGDCPQLHPILSHPPGNANPTDQTRTCHRPIPFLS